MERFWPCVLVGGKSRRFGRDKLREPLDGGALVDRPLRVLREVFGGPVHGLGDCHAEVAARFDVVLVDEWPGRGPLGGILTALRRLQGAVFVLAGDVPAIEASDIRAILAACERHPHGSAVLGQTRCEGGWRIEPCIGVYRPSAMEALALGVAQSVSGEARGTALHDAIPRAEIILTNLGVNCTRNVNTPQDLAHYSEHEGEGCD